ncbi:MAG TPA: hypothetical protein VH416_01750 [Gaiellaceae bacterium]|jgi:hypothetical protein
MTELEQALVRLGGDVEFPPTPDLAGAVAGHLEPERRRRRRPLVLALAALALAVAVAFAVPPARSAILRLFGVGGVTVVRVDVLPPAQERPLGAGLGSRTDAARIERELGFRFLLPPTNGRPQLYQTTYSASTLLAVPQPVLLTELRSGAGSGILKKLAGSGTRIENVRVNGAPGLWISGNVHVFVTPQAPPRIAGNVLVWQRGAVTLRLEGKLTKQQALRLARSID